MLPRITPHDALPALDEIMIVGGEELVREMMGTFSRFAAAHVARLGEAAAHADLETGAVIAHTLKTSARQLGVLALSECCARAEVAARGGDAALFAKATAEVEEAFAASRPWVDAIATGP